MSIRIAVGQFHELTDGDYALRPRSVRRGCR